MALSQLQNICKSGWVLFLAEDKLDHLHLRGKKENIDPLECALRIYSAKIHQISVPQLQFSLLLIKPIQNNHIRVINEEHIAFSQLGVIC